MQESEFRNRPAPSPAAARTREHGFTLLELIVVVAMIGILASMVMPALRPAPTRAKEAVLKTNLLAIRQALDNFYADKGHYPPTLEELADEGYLRQVPVDPFTKSADTWEWIYEEVDEDFAPAETDLSEDGAPGIFDIRSGAPGKGRDGTPYNEW